MKKMLILLIILAFISTPELAIGDIRFGAVSAEALATAAPTPPQYATVEMIKSYGHLLTEAGGHIYSIDAFEDQNEDIVYVLEKDNDIVYFFDEYWGPRGLVQINGTIYVATVDAVYKWTGSEMEKLTGKINGFIQETTTNGKDIYILCDNDSADNAGAYMEGKYYKVTTSGKVTPVNGLAAPIGFDYDGFGVSKDGKRLARIPFGDDGIKVRIMTSGKEYFQLSCEEDYYSNGDYSVDNIIYYNNCLLANVKGSLVYYDNVSRSMPHVLVGDMKGDRLDRDSFMSQPGESLPIKSGNGNKVRLGYVLTWTIGQDGYIYGISMEKYNTYHTFRLSLPKAVKDTITFKKTK